jgi:hypothetical protein
MQKAALRTYAYPVLKLAPSVLAAVSAVTTATLKADVKTSTAQYGSHIGGALAAWQANAWIIILASTSAIIIFNFALRLIGEPWRWNAIQLILNMFRDRVYQESFPGDPIHHHRVTLFKHVQFSTRINAWPWSGWLVPMARSGHTNQKSNSIFMAPDDADKAEGVAGIAWASKRTESISQLPKIDASSDQSLLLEYSKATNVDIKVVKLRIQRLRSNPRSLIAIPIEVGNRVKWIIVLDSRRPDDLLAAAEAAATSYSPIISHLLKGA